MQKKLKNSKQQFALAWKSHFGSFLQNNPVQDFSPKKSLQSNLSLYGTVTSSKKSEKFHNFIKLNKLVLGPVWPKNLKTKLSHKKHSNQF